MAVALSVCPPSVRSDLKIAPKEQLLGPDARGLTRRGGPWSLHASRSQIETLKKTSCAKFYRRQLAFKLAVSTKAFWKPLAAVGPSAKSKPAAGAAETPPPRKVAVKPRELSSPL